MVPPHSGCHSALLAPEQVPPCPYPSRAVRRARAFLDYTLRRRDGFLVLSGAPGVGKTRLLLDLAARLPSTVRLLRWVGSDLDEAGTPGEPGKAEPALERELHEACTLAQAAGGKVLLWVDDGQALSAAFMQRVLGAAAHAATDEQPLSIIVTGCYEMPALHRVLAGMAGHRAMPLHHELRGLEEHETAAYLEHRLALAGVRAPLFRAELAPLLHAASVGVPGKLNQLIDACLRHAGDTGKAWVTEEVLAEVLEQLGWRHPVDALSVPFLPAPGAGSEAILGALERVSISLGECAGLIERELRSISEGLRQLR